VEGESDFDGDGMLGSTEDTDNATDRVYGTLGAALNPGNGAINQNGRVTIVTSGRFPESVTITAANGNVVLEAVPGVDANIDAVLSGSPDSITRQALPGIIVNAAANRIVTLRNLVSRNWTDGIQINGASRVNIDRCRVEQNINFGIRILGSAKVVISNSQINGNGFRQAMPPANNTPTPGVGIRFESQSSGTISNSSINSNMAAGISNMTGNSSAVLLSGINIFDNNPNFENIRPKKGTVPAVGQ
jgi:parallel beta-helix repeat protein